MCGICLVLSEAPSTSDNRFSFPDWLESVGLAESVRRRGPDHFDFYSYQMDMNRTLYAAAGVLHIRGSGSITRQPLVSLDGTFLLFNGEVYDGLEMQLSPDSNDTDIIFNQLQRLSSAEGDLEMVSFLSGIEGEFAIIFFDARRRCLWFCRDAFGRRSLLYSIPTSSSCTSDNNFKMLLSSVACRSKSSQESNGSPLLWSELPAGYIFCLGLDASVSERLTVYRLRPPSISDDFHILSSAFKNYRLIDVNSPSWHDLFHLDIGSQAHPDAPLEDESFENWYLDKYRQEVDGFVTAMRKATQKRVRLISNFCPCCQAGANRNNLRHSALALLFSGGVDSLLLAVLLAEELQKSGQSVDLLNVAFGTSPAIAPDRVTGQGAFSELQRLFPNCQSWKFIKIDIDQSELATWRQRRIAQLVLPSETVLDDSIGCVLWFAARGMGRISLSSNSDEISYTCPCRVLFLGTGADELLAGYSRHRKRYFDVSDEHKRDSALIEELEMELRRIGCRNLARDDRVVADHGRETRLPYLDEHFVKYVNGLPLNIKCDLRLRRGLGEKLILRMALRSLGVKPEFYRLPKRAMQFGSRIAKAENRKEKGGDRCERLVRNGDWE